MELYFETFVQKKFSLSKECTRNTYVKNMIDQSDLDPNGSNISKMDQNGSKWIKLDEIGVCISHKLKSNIFDNYIFFKMEVLSLQINQVKLV